MRTLVLLLALSVLAPGCASQRGAYIGTCVGVGIVALGGAADATSGSNQVGGASLLTLPLGAIIAGVSLLSLALRDDDAARFAEARVTRPGLVPTTRADARKKPAPVDDRCQEGVEYACELR